MAKTEERKNRVLPIIFVGVPILWALIFTGIALKGDEPRTCPPAADVAIPGNPEMVSTKLTLRDPGNTQVNLGNSLGTANATLVLTTEATVMPDRRSISLAVDSFRRDADPDVSAAVVAWSRFRSAREAELHICVQRSSAPGGAAEFSLDPGKYSGSVTVTDPRLPPTSVPFSVSIAYPNWGLPLALWAILIPISSLYASVIRQDPESHASTQGTIRESWKFLALPLGIVSVIAGAIASLSAYYLSYLSSPIWGESTWDWFTLIGAMFTAFVTAATAFRFVSVIAASKPASAPPTSVPVTSPPATSANPPADAPSGTG